VETLVFLLVNRLNRKIIQDFYCSNTLLELFKLFSSLCIPTCSALFTNFKYKNLVSIYHYFPQGGKIMSPCYIYGQFKPVYMSLASHLTILATWQRWSFELFKLFTWHLHKPNLILCVVVLVKLNVPKEK